MNANTTTNRKDEFGQKTPEWILDLDPLCLLGASALGSYFRYCQRNFGMMRTYQHPSSISDWKFKGRGYVALGNRKGLLAICRVDSLFRACVVAPQGIPAEVYKAMEDHHRAASSRAKGGR